MVIAGGLRLMPAGETRGAVHRPPVPPDGFGGDYFLLGLNWCCSGSAAWLTYDLAKRLFDARAGWLAALALLLSVPTWQQTVAVNGTPLLMVLALAAFGFWHRIEVAAEAGEGRRAPPAWLGALGAARALMFLTEYSAGALVAVALGFAARDRQGTAENGRVPWWRSRWFLVVSGPWIARNLALTGQPIGLTLQNVALKFGDPTAEPANMRATLECRSAVGRPEEIRQQDPAVRCRKT